MSSFFFVCDLHGQIDRYEKLFQAIEREKPGAVFIGGDLTPAGFGSSRGGVSSGIDFFSDVLLNGFSQLKQRLGKDYPDTFLILGNDDVRKDETDYIRAESNGVWFYMHDRKIVFNDYWVYGYSTVPPTPFLLKDWERYDVSRHVDPGCISPEDGWRTLYVEKNHIRFATIKNDLDHLVGKDDLSRAIMLFHTPPYRTKLDRAALDGKVIDNVPLDVHVGSIAVRRLIEDRQPLITLHGHIHESARITGSWKDRIGNTYLFSAAHDGPELALVRFDPEYPQRATREII